MELDFIKLSPAENTTVLITNYVPPSKYQEVADKVLAYSHLCAEQLGFLTAPKHYKSDAVIRLEMAGGEFCGNGVLAMGAYVNYTGICENNNFLVESSGCDGILKCQVSNYRNNYYRVKSSMPLDFDYRRYKYNVLDGVLMELKGITHFIFEDNGQLKKEKTKKLIRKLYQKLKTPALGFIPYKKKKGIFEIKPCIYVSETDSLVFERSCGSGTLALGLFLAAKEKKSLLYNIKQPGGVITVQVKGRVRRGDFKVQEAYIENEVQLSCVGKVII